MTARNRANAESASALIATRPTSCISPARNARLIDCGDNLCSRAIRRASTPHVAPPPSPSPTHAADQSSPSRVEALHNQGRSVIPHRESTMLSSATVKNCGPLAMWLAASFLFPVIKIRELRTISPRFLSARMPHACAAFLRARCDLQMEFGSFAFAAHPLFTCKIFT